MAQRGYRFEMGKDAVNDIDPAAASSSLGTVSCAGCSGLARRPSHASELKTWLCNGYPARHLSLWDQTKDRLARFAVYGDRVRAILVCNFHLSVEHAKMSPSQCGARQSVSISVWGMPKCLPLSVEHAKVSPSQCGARQSVSISVWSTPVSPSQCGARQSVSISVCSSPKVSPSQCGARQIVPTSVSSQIRP